jgi:glycosyltransferase involved in cell wall biosynthesis
VLSTLKPDNSWLSWSNRIRRKLPPQREFPRDKICGYPVFRGWDMDRANEAANRFRPDVIIIQTTHPHQFLRVLEPTGIPLCAYFHDVLALDHLKDLAGTGLRVLTNSDFTAARFKEQCGLKSDVILPLVDPRHYVTETHPARVLFVNTAPHKGCDTAFAIAEKRPDVGFDFILNWSLAADKVVELQARAAKSGNITLHRPTGDMRALYAKTRLVLVPTHVEEAWGRMATEAHINGIPVLGSDRGGLPEAIGPGGLTVAHTAPIADWLAAFARIWDDRKAYDEFARAARAYSKRPEVQPDTIVAKLQHVLRELIASRRRVAA